MARIKQRPVNKLELHFSGSIVFVSRPVLVLVVLAIGLLIPAASAQEFERSRRAATRSRRAATLSRQFNATVERARVGATANVERARLDADVQIEEAEANFAPDVGSLLDTYLEELQTIQEAETTAGRLDAAIEVRDSIAEITSKRDELTQLSGETAGTTEAEPTILERLDGQVWKFGDWTHTFSGDGVALDGGIHGINQAHLIPYADGVIVAETPEWIVYIEFNTDFNAATRFNSPYDSVQGERLR